MTSCWTWYLSPQASPEPDEKGFLGEVKALLGILKGKSPTEVCPHKHSFT